MFRIKQGSRPYPDFARCYVGLARNGKVRNGGRCPANPALSSLSPKTQNIVRCHFKRMPYFPTRISTPDTNLLPLVCQVLSAGEVVRLDARRRGAEIILGAAGRGEVAVVARILRHLRCQDLVSLSDYQLLIHIVYNINIKDQSPLYCKLLWQESCLLQLIPVGMSDRRNLGTRRRTLHNNWGVNHWYIE